MTTTRTEKKADLFKPVLRTKEMEDELYKEIEKWAKDSIEIQKEKFKNENEIANFIKKNLEDKYKDRDLCWHVIVGRNFGGFITYKEKFMTYFYVGQVGFLIFATPDV